MDVAYPLLIQEDVAQLQAAEKAARDAARPPAPPSRRHLKNELQATVSRLAVQRVFAMDGAEGSHARFGLKVTHRRLWCPFGSRPPWTPEHQYHWF
jgi:hypothetical protein